MLELKRSEKWRSRGKPRLTKALLETIRGLPERRSKQQGPLDRYCHTNHVAAVVDTLGHFKQEGYAVFRNVYSPGEVKNQGC